MEDHRSGWKAAAGFALTVLASGWVLYVWRKLGSRGIVRVVSRVEPGPAKFLRLAPSAACSRDRPKAPAHPRRPCGAASQAAAGLQQGLGFRGCRGFRLLSFLRLDGIRREPQASAAFSAPHAVSPAGPMLAFPPGPSPQFVGPPVAPVLASESGDPEPCLGVSPSRSLAVPPSPYPSVPASLCYDVLPSRRVGVPLRALARLLLLPFLHRRLRLALAAVAFLILSWSIVPASALRDGLAAAGRPLHARAAFSWQETFENGFGAWTRPSALSVVKSRAVLVRGLALHGPTMGLKTYKMNFSARVERKSIGWVIRASGPRDYYLFKLVERGRSPEGMRFDLVRYSVVAGVASARATEPLVVAGPRNDFLDISVRVTEDQILTLVNGFGVDILKHPQGRTGGAGFLAENGEAFLVRALTISGNEDFLGLFLRGAEDTFHQISSQLSAISYQQASRRPQANGVPATDS